MRQGFLASLRRIIAAAVSGAALLAAAPLVAQESGEASYDAGPQTLFTWARGVADEGGPPGRDEPLVSDRPDFTEASTTVGRGVAQLEMGYTYFHDTDGPLSIDAHSFPEALLRVGVFAEWLEFRIAYNHGWEELQLGGARVDAASGSQDLYLGIKIGLTPQDGWLPEMALVPQMTVPLGSAFSAEEVLPGANWLYGWDISEGLATGGSTQLNKRIDGDSEEYYELAQSWTVNYTLTERLGAYTEWFALFPSGATFARPEHYFDGGFVFSVTNDLQLDVRGGVGLNSAAADYFVGTGLVRRF